MWWENIEDEEKEKKEDDDEMMAGESVFCFFQQANKLTYLQQLLHFWAQQQQNSRFSDRSFVESDTFGLRLPCR